MKHVRLLIADDDVQVLRFLGDLLSDDFCVVGTVSDGRALIAAAVELRPHIVITDIDMPTMNGIEAVRQIEALMPDVKVIFLTSHEDQESVLAAFAAGASAFLVKNGTPDLRGRLRAIIRNLLHIPQDRHAGQVHAYGNSRSWREQGVA